MNQANTASHPRATLDGIQMLRALAAIAVVVHHTLTNLADNGHAQSVLNRLAHFDELGAAGVDLFFVISGFIMLYVSHREFGQPGAVSRFLYRRAIRIYPLYWLYTLVVLALAATPWLFRNLQIDAAYVIQSLLLIPAQRPGPNDSIHPILDQGWTLSYEVGFYLIFACCLRYGSLRSTLRILPLLFGALFGAGLLLGTDTAIGEFLRLPLTFEFFYGVVLAAALLKGPQLSRWRRRAALAAVLVFAASAAFHVDPLMRPIVWGIPSTLLVCAAMHGGPVGSRLGRLCVQLGNASYSIYLTHAFVIFAMVRVLKAFTVPPSLALLVQGATVVCCVAVGYLAFVWIEKPMLERVSAVRNRSHYSP